MTSTKTPTVFEALVTVVIENAEATSNCERRDFTVQQLQRLVARELDREVSLSAIRKAIAHLPERAVERHGHQLTVHIRHYLTSTEFLPALKVTLEALDRYDRTPTIVSPTSEVGMALRRALLLSPIGLINAFEWSIPATSRQFEYDAAGFYGATVRRAAA